MKHTKGKWIIHKEVLNSPQPEYIYGGPENTIVCDFRKLNPNLIDEVLEQQQANAKLIAAAPDLLTACEVAVLALTFEPINPEDIEFIKKAIAEATQ